jgi:hypothetical protein
MVKAGTQKLLMFKWVCCQYLPIIFLPQKPCFLCNMIQLNPESFDILCNILAIVHLVE